MNKTNLILGFLAALIISSTLLYFGSRAGVVSLATDEEIKRKVAMTEMYTYADNGAYQEALEIAEQYTELENPEISRVHKMASSMIEKDNSYAVSTNCTEELMKCPDGSEVGRYGLNCEFAACPSREQGSEQPLCMAPVKLCANGRDADICKGQICAEDVNIPEFDATLVEEEFLSACSDVTPWVASSSDNNIEKVPTVSMCVLSSVPISDVLTELAFQVEYKHDVDNSITEGIDFKVEEQPFDAVVNEICRRAELDCVITKNSIVVKKREK